MINPGSAAISATIHGTSYPFRSSWLNNPADGKCRRSKPTVLKDVKNWEVFSVEGKMSDADAKDIDLRIAEGGSPLWRMSDTERIRSIRQVSTTFNDIKRNDDKFVKGNTNFTKEYDKLSKHIPYVWPHPGEPLNRGGKIGSGWRHLCLVKAYGGDQIMYVDGKVNSYDLDQFNAELRAKQSSRPHMRELYTPDTELPHNFSSLYNNITSIEPSIDHNALLRPPTKTTYPKIPTEMSPVNLSKLPPSASVILNPDIHRKWNIVIGHNKGKPDGFYRKPAPENDKKLMKIHA